MCVKSFNKHKLYIGCWNINGYKHKGFNKYSDPRFLRELENKDILCLIETHCSLDEALSLQGYRAVHLVRPKSKRTNKISGGLSIYVKDNIRAGVKFLEHASNDYIWMRLDGTFFGLNKDLFICFLYNPPAYSSYSQTLDENIFDNIVNDVVKYSENGNILLAGDLNARTGNGQLDFIEYDDYDSNITQLNYNDYTPDGDLPKRYSRDSVVSSRGKELNDFCIHSGMRILNGRTMGDFSGQMTCHTNNGSSVVDYCIASENLFENISFFKIHKFLGDLSDHCQISVMLNINCLINKADNDNLKQIPPRYIWNENSAALFQNALESTEIQQKISKFNSADFENNPDSMAKEINSILRNTADISLLTKKYRTTGKKKSVKKYPKWYNSSLISMRKKLNEKADLLEKYPRDPVVRSAFYSFLKNFRKLRKIKRKEYYSSLINELDSLRENSPNKYWSLLRDLSASENKSSPSEVSPDEWFHYFQDLNKLPEKFSTSSISKELKTLESQKIYTELDNKITCSEISKAISSLKNKKSCGFDLILNEMLKNSQIHLLTPLSKLFNCILSTGIYPKEWLKGYLVPIFKSGSKEDPSNYRGIAVVSNLGKLFAKILNTRLEKFLTDRNIIRPEQIGFCKGKRTSDHIFVLKTLIEKYTQQGNKKLFTCFIDLRKAFDTVWHDGLFYKLRKLGISDLFYNVIKQMYNNNELSVKVDSDTVTDFFKSKIGVRQGDNLSPCLFNIFINDLPEIFDSTCEPVCLDKLHLNCLLYADDLVLISESAIGLQSCIDKLSSFCDKWGLGINLKKSKSLIFNSSGRLEKHIFKLNNTPIERGKTYKYLGINFSISGSFSDAKQDLYNRGLKALFKMNKCFEGRKPKLKTLFHVFDHTVKPILLYGADIWGAFASKKLNTGGDTFISKLFNNIKQESVHLKFCKYMLGVGKRSTTLAVMGELGRYPLYLEIIVTMFKYLYRLSTTDDVLLSEAFTVSKNLNIQKKYSWYSCLESLMDYMNITQNCWKNNKNKLQKLILNKLKIKYNSIWHTALFKDKVNGNGGNKLRTYRLFKNNIKFEKYLSLLNEDKRRLFTKFRISAHTLEIEQGRYRGLRIEDRTCSLCKNTAIGDEIHFLLQCPILNNVRNDVVQEIGTLYPNFNTLDRESQFLWLMSCEDKFIIESVSSLLIKLNDHRNNILSNI